MSLPTNMKTGLNPTRHHETIFPETFFIIYLILGAILRRCGFKDAIVYSEHNDDLFNQDIFDSGVLFNLFSEYGVGKSLEPLISELFTTMSLDYDLNHDNIFFREIIRLTTNVSKVIREQDPSLETEWLLHYAINMEDSSDNIAEEREERLQELIDDFAEDDISDDNSDDIISDLEGDIHENGNYENEILDDNLENIICDCSFCNEFRKYHKPSPDRNVTFILNDVLNNIAKEINGQK